MRGGRARELNLMPMARIVAMRLRVGTTPDGLRPVPSTEKLKKPA